MTLEPSALQALLDLAHRHEATGDADGAVDCYVRANAPEEAMRVLSASRRFLEAAALAMRTLAVAPEHIDRVPEGQRRLALLAAICFGRADEVTTAVTILTGLKEHQRAAALLERAGDRVGAARLRAEHDTRRHGAKPSAPGRTAVGGGAVTLQTAQRFEQQGQLEHAVEAYVHLKRYGDAGRLADRLGKVEDAAQLYADAGLPYEAGRAYAQVGDTGRAIQNWVAVSHDDPRYRQTCVELIRLSALMKHFDVQADMFLGRFRRDGPRDARELEAFYALASLYAGADLLEDAKEVLRTLVHLPGGYRDAAALLQALERRTAAQPRAQEGAMRDDVAFARLGERRGSAGPLADLPDLPALPDLPGVPSWPDLPKGAPTGSRASGGDARTHAPAAAPRVTAYPGSLGAPGVVEGTLLRTPSELGAAPRQRPEGSLPAVGERLGTRYRVIRELGRGGMAVVYEAEDDELGETVALKLFLLEQDEQGLARFRLELKLTRQLSHPNIARLYDIGVHEGRRFISMELLRGRDLRALLARPLSPAVAVNYLMQASLGLGAAHQKGVIHRDIKPENLFITNEGVLKVMDFGIAKGQQASGLTQTGAMGGTPHYMSPDQITAFTQVTPSSDLYSLGVVAFEMLTGRPPFHHDEVMPLLMLHLQAPVPSPRALAPHLSGALEAIVLRLLAKRPEQRYSSASELHQALASLEGQERDARG